MSCYTRHLDDLLPADPTPADRRALDARIRDELRMAGAGCPEVWAAVKERRSDAAFVASVGVAMAPAKMRHDGGNA